MIHMLSCPIEIHGARSISASECPSHPSASVLLLGARGKCGSDERALRTSERGAAHSAAAPGALGGTVSLR